MKYSSRLKTILTAIFLLFSVSLAFSDERTDKVDKLFTQWDKQDTPGCALAIIKDGKIIYQRGYGMANLEHNIPITPQTVFYVGSVSKQFVALCVAMLAKQEKLSFDHDIRKYVPELPDFGTPITIRHLIHHTSGLRDYLTLLDIAGIDFGFFHQQDVVDLLSRQQELNFKPGEEYLYSNSGYFLLAFIVKAVSRKTLREFAKKNIFKPLRMKNSRFQDDYRKILNNRAAGYFPAEEGKYKNFISTFDCVGSGGLFTSVEDLFLWDQNFYHYKVGGKNIINQMHTPGKLNNGQKLNYAYALQIKSYRGLRTIEHGGALGGYRSTIIRFPEQNFSVICLSNLSSFNPAKLAKKVADIYLADLFKVKTTETKNAEENQFIELPKKKLKEKVGFYINQETGELRRLSIRNGKLMIEAFGQKFPLEALIETEFQVLNAPIKVIIKFEKKIKGKPLILHVCQEGEKPETYEAVKLIKPIPEQLKEYEGDYFSEELQVTFRLRLKEGKLNFVHRNAPQAPLQPTLKDKFTVRGWKINFLRDIENEISSFTLNAGRVKNLLFQKK